MKRSQSFLALFIVAMALFFYGIYLYNSYTEISFEQENYKKETELIEKLKSLKEGTCINLNTYTKISAFTYEGKGVIEVGPFIFSIEGLTLHSPDFDDWPNDLVSYKRTNTTYIFPYIKKDSVYVQIVYPFEIKPSSKEGYIKSVCLENKKLIIY